MRNKLSLLTPCRPDSALTIKEFDKVLLKTGEVAYIADILKAGVAYVVDIDKADGTIETEIIEQDGIERVLS